MIWAADALNAAAEASGAAAEDQLVKLVLTVGGVLVALVMVSGKARELLGSIRQASAEKDDADLAEMRKTLNNVRSELADERRSAEAWRRTCSELYGYILRAQRDPARLAEKVPEPPAVDTGTD